MKLVVGIDPGTGSSSACGLCAFDVDTKSIVLAKAVWAQNYQHPTRLRIKDVVEQVESEILALIATHGTIVVGIESFVMRGKGGETLQRMIGATLTSIPYDIEVREIQNTTIKKFVGTSGRAAKDDVAAGVMDFFKSNTQSVNVVWELTETQNWDVLDALAIAISANGQKGERK